MYTIIYGLNSPAHAFLKSTYNTGNNIFACTSGNEEFAGQQAKSLQDIAQMNMDDIERIVICSMFFSEICQSFSEHQIPLEKVHFFDHTRTLLLPHHQVIERQVQPSDILYAIYDLSIHLACFDVFNFAVLAEVERLKQNKRFIHFLIVHDRSYSNPMSSILFHEHHDHSWRIDKILKAVFACLPTKLAIAEFAFKEDLQSFIEHKEAVFPIAYKTQQRGPVLNTLSLKQALLTHSLSVLSAPQNAKNIVSQFLATLPTNTKPVVITLREYGSQPKRNSDIEQWAKFLQQLDLQQYCPVIVRDTYHNAQLPDPRLSQFIHFPQAALDFTIRLALYERAYINLGVSCGPNYGISFIKGARSIIFQMTDEDNPANSSLTAQRSGLEIGADFFFNDSALQKTIWHKDDCEQIVSAFQQLVAHIEQHKNSRGATHGS